VANESGWCLREKGGSVYLNPIQVAVSEVQSDIDLDIDHGIEIDTESDMESNSGANSGGKKGGGFFGSDNGETWYELRDNDGEVSEQATELKWLHPHTN